MVGPHRLRSVGGDRCRHLHDHRVHRRQYHRPGDLERGFRVPGVPLLPIASIVACGWLLNLTGLTWIRFLIWMAIGVVIYFAYGRRHSVLARRETANLAPT
jgi:amino acid transporter